MKYSMKDADKLKFIKGVFVFVIIYCLLFVAYIQKIRQYLDNIESCNCAPLEYVSNLATLETAFLYILYFIMVICFITLVCPIWAPISMALPYVKSFMYIYKVVLILLILAFVYNVYEYYIHLSPNCSCIESIESAMMYLQSLFYIGTYILPAFMLVVSSVSLYMK
jgi:hypothetical protein